MAPEEKKRPLYPQDLMAWYDENIVGTLDSSWDFHRTAALSSYSAAYEQLAKIRKEWKANPVRREQQPELTMMAVYTGYSFGASGPLLSSILLPVFAIESFIGLCAYAHFIQDNQSLSTLAFTLQGFDRQSFPERINTIIQLTCSVNPPKDLIWEVSDLIEFRNSTAHDSPFLNAPMGVQLSLKNKKVNPGTETTKYGYYPRLFLTPLPLDLSHCRRAINTHDQLVDFILTNANDDFLKSFFNIRNDVDRGIPRIAALDGRLWKEAENFQMFWSKEVVPWIEDLPLDLSIGLMKQFQEGM